MNLRVFLLLMTGVAVVGDSMLHPFYPLYFLRVFGVDDPVHVGRYIAACSLLVLLMFPVWAGLARYVSVLKLLIATQLAAGTFSWLCADTRSLTAFWLLSLAMIACKASYLLVYPFAMSREPAEQQLGTIGLLAFVVYFGNILAALLSGLVLELSEPGQLFRLMAAADALQAVLCVAWLLGRHPERQQPAAERRALTALSWRALVRLGCVMFLLYFSAYLGEPFFAAYWESLAGHGSKLTAGAVFAIPGLAALCALFFNARFAALRSPALSGIVPSIVFAMLGLLTQASAVTWAVLCGRFVYGWALFQAIVRLDALLFRASTPQSYASDFAKANLFQGLGVLAAGSSAGALVPTLGLKSPLLVAAFGFALGAALFATLLGDANDADFA